MARSALTSKPLPLASAYTSRMSSAIAFLSVYEPARVSRDVADTARVTDHDQQCQRKAFGGDEQTFDFI